MTFSKIVFVVLLNLGLLLAFQQYVFADPSLYYSLPMSD